MSKIHRLPAREDVEQQAAEWVARMLADDCTNADRARCLDWRRQRPVHERVYQETLSTYRQLRALAPVVRATSLGIEMHEATRTRRHRYRWASMAAVCAAMALLLVPLWLHWRTASEFETGIGEMAALTLPDGSRMELNSDSAVRVAYRDEARVIHLDRGEAYFAVAHDTARPFWVVTGSTWVRAVGTAFNVYRREDDVRVTVSEGRVKVATVAGRDPPSDEALAAIPVSLLAAGEQVDVRPTGPAKRALPPPAVEREVAWRTGTLHFQDQPLAEVAQELARYTPLRIELAANARDVRMGGTFQTNPTGVEAWLKALHDGLGLEVRRDGQRVIVQQQ